MGEDLDWGGGEIWFLEVFGYWGKIWGLGWDRFESRGAWEKIWVWWGAENLSPGGKNWVLWGQDLVHGGYLGPGGEICVEGDGDK